MREIPKYGDLMSMEDFVETCLHFDFIDYDGFGYYSDGIKMSEKVIYPSNVIDEGAGTPPVLAVK